MKRKFLAVLFTIFSASFGVQATEMVSGNSTEVVAGDWNSILKSAAICADTINKLNSTINASNDFHIILDLNEINGKLEGFECGYKSVNQQTIFSVVLSKNKGINWVINIDPLPQSVQTYFKVQLEREFGDRAQRILDKTWIISSDIPALNEVKTVTPKPANPLTTSMKALGNFITSHAQ